MIDLVLDTASKVSKYGIFFGLNKESYGVSAFGYRNLSKSKTQEVVQMRI